MTKGEPDLSTDFVTARMRAMVGDPHFEIAIRSTSIWYVNQAYATTYSVEHLHPGHLQPRLDYAPLNQCFRVVGDEDPVAAGLERLRDPGPEGAAIRAELVKALQLKNTEFNAQDVEMNQRYESSAVRPERDAAPKEWRRDRQSYLQATTRPGAKFPHVWLVNHRGHRVSTLDVVGKGRMSLVTGLSGTAWVEAVKRIAYPSLSAVVIGSADAQDLYGDWARHREIAEAGALLMRPDGYIA